MVLTKHIVKNELCALVVELVDTRDLKSLGVRAVPVQVRPGAPSITNKLSIWLGFFVSEIFIVALIIDNITPNRP